MQRVALPKTAPRHSTGRATTGSGRGARAFAVALSYLPAWNFLSIDAQIAFPQMSPITAPTAVMMARAVARSTSNSSMTNRARRTFRPNPNPSPAPMQVLKSRARTSKTRSSRERWSTSRIVRHAVCAGNPAASPNWKMQLTRARRCSGMCRSARRHDIAVNSKAFASPRSR